MATSEENRKRLRDALALEAKRAGIVLSDLTLDFFADRALAHINSRVTASAERDLAVLEAAASAGRLVQNLRPVVNESIEKRMLLADAQSYVQSSTSCFYPWCKPRP